MAKLASPTVYLHECPHCDRRNVPTALGTFRTGKHLTVICQSCRGVVPPHLRRYIVEHGRRVEV